MEETEAPLDRAQPTVESLRVPSDLVDKGLARTLQTLKRGPKGMSCANEEDTHQHEEQQSLHAKQT